MYGHNGRGDFEQGLGLNLIHCPHSSGAFWLPNNRFVGICGLSLERRWTLLLKCWPKHGRKVNCTTPGYDRFSSWIARFLGSKRGRKYCENSGSWRPGNATTDLIYICPIKELSTVSHGNRGVGPTSIWNIFTSAGVSPEYKAIYLVSNNGKCNWFLEQLFGVEFRIWNHYPTVMRSQMTIHSIDKIEEIRCWAANNQYYREGNE